MLNDNQLDAAIAATPAPRVTDDHIDSVIVDRMFRRLTATLLICVLTLRNGFTVTGESACASPANYVQAIGERIAFDNARDKIWLLEGYLLRERQYQLNKTIAATERA
ncbi:Gp49 family protein [Sphingomonas sp. H160509]|uniref:Gp49 family protein n=1 Tax=Sphingomonas sp. H160509 TaxID=2955313 RepID=UPI0020973227|nr:Gp49 family protein [Sphingomonas sp. H160509]MDD1450830.1 Gp49 family protein [Sphingomonas sp. H160509]